jgi:hypothetical protein
MLVIPVTWKERLGGLQLEASSEEKLVSPHLSKQGGHVGACLSPQDVCRRCRYENFSLLSARQKVRPYPKNN